MTGSAWLVFAVLAGGIVFLAAMGFVLIPRPFPSPESGRLPVLPDASDPRWVGSTAEAQLDAEYWRTTRDRQLPSEVRGSEWTQAYRDTDA